MAEMHTIPIADRPPHGPWFSKIFFPLLFNIGSIGINSAQFLAVPLLLIPVVGRRWFEAVIGWTKDGYGRLCTSFCYLSGLCALFVTSSDGAETKKPLEGRADARPPTVIAITVLFAPTSLVITTDAPPDLANLVERDAEGRMTRINLPDRLVVMANHQAYTDWMYLWILACYSGHSRGVIILLKEALKKIPVIGWGMVSAPPTPLLRTRTKYPFSLALTPLPKWSDMSLTNSTTNSASSNSYL